jgi:hypothetical protein
MKRHPPATHLAGCYLWSARREFGVDYIIVTIPAWPVFVL